MNQPAILIEITKLDDWAKSDEYDEYDVFLHKVPSQMEGTQWEKIGSVPFKHIGFLSAEEVGQFMGGN